MSIYRAGLRCFGLWRRVVDHATGRKQFYSLFAVCLGFRKFCRHSRFDHAAHFERSAAQIVILTTTVFAAFGGVIIGAGETWSMPTPLEFSYLAGAAILVSIANALMVTAYRSADIAILSPLRYLVVVWAAGTGLLIFGEHPGLVAIIGTVLVVGSGLFMGYRERRRNLRARGVVPSVG